MADGSPNIKTYKDIVSELNKAFSQFESSVKQATDLNRVVEDIFLSSNKLTKGFKDTSDIITKMKTDKSFFNKMEKEIASKQKENFNKYWVPLNKLQKDILANVKVRKVREELLNKVFGARRGIENNLKDISTRRLGLLKKEADFHSSIGQALKGMAGGKIDSIIGFFKHPALLAALIVWKALTGAVSLITEAFKMYWEFLNKTVKAQADLNRQFGSSTTQIGTISREAMRMGVTFESLGFEFDEGARLVGEFTKSMMLLPQTDEEARKVAETGIRLTKVFGMSTEQAGKLMLMFQRSTGSIDGVKESMTEASMSAQKYGVSVNDVRADMAENMDLLARFGVRNRLVMTESSAKARSYGLNIKEVNQAFGKQMDTFEGTSQVAAKLNTVFGTHINSYRIMLEKDPTERMLMLRDELVKQRKSWDELNVHEKNVITTTLGVNEEFAALAFAPKDARKALEGYELQQERRQKADKDWQRGLLQVKEVIVALERKIKLLAVSFVNLLSRMFGFEKAGEVAVPIAVTLGEFIDNLSKSMDEANVKPLFDLTKIFESIPALVPKIESMAKAIERIADSIDVLVHPLESLKKLDFGTMFGAAGGEIKVAREHLKALKKEKGKITEKEFESAVKELSSPRIASLRQEFATDVQDALVTKKGQVIKFHPQDNILATKQSIARTPGGTTTATGKTGSMVEKIVIMPAPIFLDGKKISEVQFRIATQGG